jgi:hypothetical protein
MLEHFCALVTYRLKDDLGYNRQLRTTVGKALAALKFAATRRGPLATPTGDVMAVFKTRQDLDRGDGQFLARLMSVADVSGEERGQIDSHGGVSCAAEILRPTSEGSVWITSADPSAPLSIDPNYLATDYDRRTTVVRGAQDPRDLRAFAARRRPVARARDRGAAHRRLLDHADDDLGQPHGADAGDGRPGRGVDPRHHTRRAGSSRLSYCASAAISASRHGRSGLRPASADRRADNAE